MTTVFEVHTLKGTQWMIDSHHQTRDAAMEAAKLLHGEGHLEGVKVIKDTLDEKTGMSKELVIFDTSKQRKAAAAPASAPAPASDASKAAAQPAAAASAGADKGSSTTGTALKSIMWLAILLVLAGAVLYLTGGLSRR